MARRMSNTDEELSEMFQESESEFDFNDKNQFIEYGFQSETNDSDVQNIPENETTSKKDQVEIEYESHRKKICLRLRSYQDSIYC